VLFRSSILHNCCIYQKYKNFSIAFFGGEVVVAIVAATSHRTLIALSAEFKHELKNLPLTEETIFTWKLF
jgi:hypothetical protein